MTIAIITLVISPKMGSWPLRRIAYIGAFIAIMAHTLSALVSGIPLLITMRLMAGIGGGLLLATGNAAIARANNPDRFAATILFATGATAVLVFNIMPVFIERWQLAGAFGFEALFILLMLPFMRFLPTASKVSTSDSEQAGGGIPKIYAFAFVLVVGLYFARDNAMWAFCLQIGLRTGLSNQEVSTILGISALLGLAGAVLAAIIGVRFGRLLPMLIGLILNTVLSILITQTDHPTVFIVCVLGFNVVVFFTVPYFFGMAAALDPKGRLLAVCGGSLTLGGASGPMIGGFLIERYGYFSLAVFILIAMIIVTIIACTINHEVGKLNQSSLSSE